MRLRVAICAAALATVVATVGTTVTTLAVADASEAGPRVAAAAPRWSASFEGFPGAGWRSSWGVVPGGQFGFDRMVPTTDGGLLVRHGGEFHTDLNGMGLPSMAAGATLSLRYDLKFPVDHDFSRGGTLPGLYGGTAWSTRFTWHDGNRGGVDGLGPGSWSYPADGGYHTIEQLVDRIRRTVTVWLDGAEVFTAAVTGIGAVPFGGIVFSTSATEAGFRNFSLSTAVQH